MQCSLLFVEDGFSVISRLIRCSQVAGHIPRVLQAMDGAARPVNCGHQLAPSGTAASTSWLRVRWTEGRKNGLTDVRSAGSTALLPAGSGAGLQSGRFRRIIPCFSVSIETASPTPRAVSTGE